MAETPFKTWLDGLAALPGNVVTGDLVAVIRGGVSYKADGSKFAGSGGGGGDTVSRETVVYSADDFGYGATLNTNGAYLRELRFQFASTAASCSFSATQGNAMSGAANLYPGSTATGKAGFQFIAPFSLANSVSGKDTKFVGRAMPGDSASSLTDRYTSIIGLVEQASLDNPYSASLLGVYFRYSDDINSGKWQAVISDGTNVNVFDTGVAGGAQFRKFKILVDRRTAANGGAGIRFYIDGVLTNTVAIASATAWANASAAYVAGTAAIYKRVGTGGINMNVDYIEQQFYRID